MQNDSPSEDLGHDFTRFWGPGRANRVHTGCPSQVIPKVQPTGERMICRTLSLTADFCVDSSYLPEPQHAYEHVHIYAHIDRDIQMHIHVGKDTDRAIQI